MTTSAQAFKDAIYQQISRLGKAVSSPKRLEILDLLCQGPRTVEVLAKEAHLTVANASRHLQILHAARLVEAERRGLFVLYRLATGRVCEFARTMRSLAEERLAEMEQLVRRFLAGREGTEPVDREQLLTRIRAGAVTVLDVRPTEEFRAGHIPGAVSVPLRELPRRLADLPRDRDIVAYCRGPYCVLAVEAVSLLRRHGFTAYRLDWGVPDWRAHGLAVESVKEAP